MVGCSTNSDKNKELKFHLIPIGGTRRQSWLTAINRCEVRADGSVNQEKLWEPKSNYTYVCGRHFITATMKRKSPRKRKRSQQDRAPIDRGEVQDSDGEIKTDMDLETDKSPEPDDNPDSNEDVVGGPEVHNNICDSCISPMQEPLSSSEREQWSMEMDNLRRERDEAQAKIVALQNIIQERSENLSSINLEGDDHKCMMLTGLKWEVFEKLFTFLTPFISVTGVKKKRACPFVNSFF